MALFDTNGSRDSYARLMTNQERGHQVDQRFFESLPGLGVGLGAGAGVAIGVAVAGATGVAVGIVVGAGVGLVVGSLARLWWQRS